MSEAPPAKEKEVIFVESAAKKAKPYVFFWALGIAGFAIAYLSRLVGNQFAEGIGGAMMLFALVFGIASVMLGLGGASPLEQAVGAPLGTAMEGFNKVKAAPGWLWGKKWWIMGLAFANVTFPAALLAAPFYVLRKLKNWWTGKPATPSQQGQAIANNVAGLQP